LNLTQGNWIKFLRISNQNCILFDNAKNKEADYSSFL